MIGGVATRGVNLGVMRFEMGCLDPPTSKLLTLLCEMLKLEIGN